MTKQKHPTPQAPLVRSQAAEEIDPHGRILLVDVFSRLVKMLLGFKVKPWASASRHEDHEDCSCCAHPSNFWWGELDLPWSVCLAQLSTAHVLARPSDLRETPPALLAIWPLTIAATSFGGVPRGIPLVGMAYALMVDAVVLNQSDEPLNLRVVKAMEEKHRIWKEEPNFHNLQMFWLSIGRNELFATPRIHVPQLIPSFYYIFPMRDMDQHHLFTECDVRDIPWMALEPRVTYQLARRMRQCCKSGGHFLDVGGNFGWYALMAAALVCEVASFGGLLGAWRWGSCRFCKQWNMNTFYRLTLDLGYSFGYLLGFVTHSP